ncbi:hypothetical protein EJB05_38265, partial [Eragrostis curvula]
MAEEGQAVDMQEGDGSKSGPAGSHIDEAASNVSFTGRKRKTYAKRKPKRPNIEPADTISPGSLTRRIVNL